MEEGRLPSWPANLRLHFHRLGAEGRKKETLTSSKQTRQGKRDAQERVIQSTLALLLRTQRPQERTPILQEGKVTDSAISQTEDGEGHDFRKNTCSMSKVRGIKRFVRTES